MDLWTLMEPLFEQWVGVDSLIDNIFDIAEVYLSGFVGNDVKHKKTGSHYGTLYPSILFLYLSHKNLYLPGIADFIGSLFFLTLGTSWNIRQGPPCIIGPTLMWIRQKESLDSFDLWRGSLYFTLPLHASLWAAVTSHANLPYTLTSTADDSWSYCLKYSLVTSPSSLPLPLLSATYAKFTPILNTQQTN